MFYVKWFAPKATMFVLLWLGFVEEVAGARNVVLFLAWAVTALSWVHLTDSWAKSRAKLPDRKFIDIAGTAYSWVVLLTLIWFGAIWTAIGWAVAMLFCAIGSQATRRQRAGGAHS